MLINLKDSKGVRALLVKQYTAQQASSAPCSVFTDSECLPDLGTSPDRAQQLGGVSYGGGAVTEGRGELGRLAEVVLRVLRRLVDNT